MSDGKPESESWWRASPFSRVWIDVVKILSVMESESCEGSSFASVSLTCCDTSRKCARAASVCMCVCIWCLGVRLCADIYILCMFMHERDFREIFESCVCM